jgi:hypothetical protein
MKQVWTMAVILCALATHAAAKPVALKHDDGTQEDKRSLGGDGQAVKFERPAGTFAVTGVRVYGSRYGGGYDPAIEIAKVSICDGSLEPIVSAVVPLEKFRVGAFGWVDVPVEPVIPPETFYVHVDFYSTRTKGVYLGIDTNGGGHSISGTLGKPGSALTQGDWMLRAMGAVVKRPLLALDPASKQVLSHDDGEPDDRRSTAGAGHAVQFSAPRGEWYLASVAIHGSLYGGNFNPDRTLFHVFVCDSRMRVLSRSAHPYALFKRGQAQWVEVKVPPVRPRGKFFVLVFFNPTQAKGVYLSIDNVKRSHSLQAMPNRPLGALGPTQEWMIRAACMKRGKETKPATSSTRTSGAKTEKEKEEGTDAMEVAQWRSSLDAMEQKEDVAGIRRLLALRSAEAAKTLGGIHVTEHVFVRYVNVPEDYAEAVAQLYETCDAALRKRFGVASGVCIVPGKRLHVHLLAGEEHTLSLWTSPGSRHYPLIVNTMPTWQRGFSPPGRGGPHIVYGLAHELGHVLMGWEDSRHQWAHYLGSLLVEELVTAHGSTVWPQPYNYRAEGLARFMKEIRTAKPDRTTDAGTGRIFYEVGETFGLATWGKALAWIRKNRTGKPFHAVRLYKLDDLRDALLALGCDAGKVKALFGE